ncbi:MAG: transglycosylase domain-containing protein [Acidimicrobiales bacterium]
MTVLDEPATPAAAGPDRSATGRAASGSPPPRVGMRRRPAWRRFTRWSFRVAVILIVGIPVLAATTGLSGGWLLLFGDLPGTVPEEKPPVQAIPSKVYDAAGNEIGEFREFDLSVPMTPADVPQVLKDAVVAAEDQNFYDHKGMDPQGLARAAVANYAENDVVQGGSTITQQYVRNKYLSTERTVERKLNEIILATRVERDLEDKLGSKQAAKEEILFQYLNTTYFGGGAYGAQAAAQTYFRKDVRDLTVSEAALLAAVIPAPSRYGPRENPATAESRRKDVLAEMLRQGKITQAQYDEAVAQVLWYSGFGLPDRPATIFFPPPENAIGRYPYFIDYVRQYLIERYGPERVFRGGLRIETTIDPRLQDLAEQAVANGLAGTSAPLEMSLVSVEPATGFVRAFVGGRDFTASQVNLGLGGITGMQPGSAFKVFTLAKALEDGYGPDTVYDAPGSIEIGGYRFKGGAGGAIDLRSATANSVNTYFVQLIRDVGPNRVAELAHRLGVSRINPDKQYGLSLTLGAYEVSPLDMAAGYATIANHGVKADATPVVKVIAPDATVVEDNSGPRGTRVLNAAVADWTTELLTGVIDGGTGKRAAIGRPAAGKTGTAENYTAAWFSGFTPQLATAVWMGYSDTPKPLLGIGGFGQVMGGTIPARTWAQFMGPAMEPLPVVPFAEPGILPSPTSGIRKASREALPTITRDCGGPCVELPVLTTPSLVPTDPARPGAPPATPAPPAPPPPTTTSTTATIAAPAGARLSR